MTSLYPGGGRGTEVRGGEGGSHSLSPYRPATSTNISRQGEIGPPGPTRDGQDRPGHLVGGQGTQSATEPPHHTYLSIL